jgi:hypothetical protein
LKPSKSFQNLGRIESFYSVRPFFWLVGVHVQIGHYLQRVVKLIDAEIFAGSPHHQPVNIIPNLGLVAKVTAKGIRRIRFLPTHAD